MSNEKMENLLNLALDATEREREKSLDLDTGYDRAERTWEVIVKFGGTEEALRGLFAEKFPEEYDRIVINFIWENRDIARILINGAEGTRYENFWEDTCKKMEQLLQENFLKNYGKEADSDLVHVLAEMKLQGYTQLLNKDYSHEKFLKLSKMLKICSDCGYQVIEEETARMQ